MLVLRLPDRKVLWVLRVYPNQEHREWMAVEGGRGSPSMYLKIHFLTCRQTKLKNLMLRSEQLTTRVALLLQLALTLNVDGAWSEQGDE